MTPSRLLETRLRRLFGPGPAQTIRRIAIELEFARSFADMDANADRGFLPLIDAAERRLALLDPSLGPDGLLQTVDEIEHELSLIGDAAKSYRIHCVGHGHIDMNWMWSWPETVATTHDTFASVLGLMRDYPDLTYSQSQAAVYALTERYFPEMFEEIRQRVREGRWEVTAAHWVEGDKNLSSGESLCRHLLYTRRYFEEAFGLSPEDQSIDWEPDTFGHAATIPAIVARGGVKHYYCCRPGGGDVGFLHPSVSGGPLPRLFYWQAPDGSRVLVNREGTWYNSGTYITDNIAAGLVALARETGLHEWMNVFGIGNHGGGPTRVEIEMLREMQHWPIYPRIEFSTARRYFSKVEQEIAEAKIQIPTIAHELNFEFTGCYTSQSLIKQANRLGENLSIDAEVLATLASKTCGTYYPGADLRAAWLRVLFNQFHDILPGSGVRQTREHALSEFQEVGAITGAIRRTAIKAMTRRINTRSLLPSGEAGQIGVVSPASFEAGAGLGGSVSGMSGAGGSAGKFRPYVVFNTCAWERSERVQVTLYDTGFDPEDAVVLSESGEWQPMLYLGSLDNTWGHVSQVYSFDALGVPGLGYKTYLFCERSRLPVGASMLAQSRVSCIRPDRFRTAALEFSVDRETGGARALRDRRSGVAWSSSKTPALASFQAVLEEPQGMTAWVLGREVEPPIPLKGRDDRVHAPIPDLRNRDASLELPAGAQIEMLLAVPGTDSTVRVVQSVHALEARLDFAATVDWREIGDARRGIPGLVLVIPIPLSKITAHYEVPFGDLERSMTDGEEVPSLRYAHIAGTANTASGETAFAAITLLQDCKYGHSLHGNDDEGYTLRLRMVRSSFDPDPTPEVAVTQVRYSIVFHDEEVRPADLARLGAGWNHPLIAAPTQVQDGDEPLARSFGQIESPDIVLTSLKFAEDGGGLILRLVNYADHEQQAEVRLDPALLPVDASARAVDVLERPTGEHAELTAGVLRTRISGGSFTTVLIR